MASKSGQVAPCSLVVLLFSALLRGGETLNTEMVVYNPIVGHYDAWGRYWCQGTNQPCETNGQCCSGCCQSAVGLCSARNGDCEFFEGACSQISCPMTTSCAVLPSGTPYCFPSYDLFQPFTCYPNCPSGYTCRAFTHVYPAYNKCVVDDSCGNSACPTGLVCDYMPGVSNGMGKCVISPCDKILCAPGYTCRVKPNAYPLTAECVPSGPCAVIRCAAWHVCELVPGSYPPQGRCVPSVTDPCANIRCRYGSKCVTQVNLFPPQASCTYASSEITCGLVTCRAGYTCVMQQQDTFSPTPRAQCEPTHPCFYPGNACQPNEICLERQQLCFNKSPCPLVAECFSRNPCANVRCGRGYTCQLVQTYCPEPPCAPLAECVLTNPCYSEVSPCKANEVCTEVDVLCLVAPCARIAVCKPRFW